MKIKKAISIKRSLNKIIFNKVSSKREVQETKTISNIGNGTDNLPDYCIIFKDGKFTCSVIVIKVDKTVGVFDYRDFLDYKFTILNYQNMSSTDEAYHKMMKFIGKMIKKSGSSRYYNKKNLYHFDELNTAIFNNDLVDWIRNN